MKKNANLDEYRDKVRRMAERRKSSRRIIKAEFGSDKWVRAIQASYVLWPKEDRREQDRRITSRRTLERRDQLQRFRGMSLRQRMLKKQRQTQVLTAEEKAMLKDLHNHF